MILPTNSKYIDICENFFAVVKRSWPDCPYKIVLSVTGENKKVDGVINLYSGPKASRIDYIVKGAKSTLCTKRSKHET